jgi:hypothetical protein
MRAIVSGRRGTLLWRFAFVAFLPLLCFVGCNQSPTTQGGPTQEEDSPEEDSIGGALDLVNADVICGWAFDSSQPDTPIKVDIFDGDKKLTTILANELRDDLVKENYGNGKHAFTYATPDSLKDGKTHTIRARIAETDKELQLSPKTFKSP